jgi:hypothetical protein
MHSINELFYSDYDIGTPQWSSDVFRRAYLYPGSAFQRVVFRIRSGFSVLVYLPGNVMRAAAEVIRAQVGGAVPWMEHGQADSKITTYADIWRASTGLLAQLTNWLKGVDTMRPYAIFHNLDTLNDGHGSLDTSNEARTALFYLTECTRTGVVLGLSDLAAGPLPEAVRRPFGEEVWLEEIPMTRFHVLIPRELGQQLGWESTIPEGPAHLLASRLRWTDPCRAVRILSEVTDASDIGDALSKVTAQTRSVEFSDPATLKFGLPNGFRTPPGYEESTIRLLEDNIVFPYHRWAEYTGSDPETQLHRLPAGMVLHGPPGTGKSRLAGWVASRIGIPFRQVGAADLKRADWGLTERLVRELFRSARRAAPCMIVLDDADDLLPDRDAIGDSGLAGAERGVVNAFLQELEGFRGRLEGVLVVLTTNRYNKLDRAAKSRLPLICKIPYPLTREQIRKIVIEIGRQYGVEPGSWTPGVLDRLEDFFFKPLRPVEKNVEDPEVRRTMTEDLYSPRDISAALRMMLPASGGTPTLADVDRIDDYYRKLPQNE